MHTETFDLPVWQKAIWNDGDVLNGGTAPKWSSKIDPPTIGTRVNVNFNQFGLGTVAGYFVDHGWLGLLVDIDKQPAWHLKQEGERKRIYCFGPEVELVPVTTLDEAFKEIEG